MVDDLPTRLTQMLANSGKPSSDYDLNPGRELPANRVLRPAAVLIAVQSGPKGAEVLLTKRASHLKHHPGQIALPGGKLDPTDADATAAALRETHEEIGLRPGLVRTLGQLPTHETVTGFSVVPILAQVTGPFQPVPEVAEVEEIFTVPLNHLLDLANYRVEQRLWRGTWRRFYTVPYGPYYIWGATARILRTLADRVV